MSDKRDTRHKGLVWDADNCPISGKANVALLMDLRDELQTVNERLGHYGGIQRELRGLRRDLKQLHGNSKKAKA